MSFILGLLVGLGLSSKDSRPNVGGIQFMTIAEAMENMGKHQNPFDLQDAFQQKLHLTPESLATSQAVIKVFGLPCRKTTPRNYATGL